MIKKPYSELTNSEKEDIFKFISSKNIDFKPSFSEADKYITDRMFENGNSFFTLWENDKPIATIGCVVKDVIHKGEVFVTGINIDDNEVEKLTDVINETEKFIVLYKPKTIKLGVTGNKKNYISFIEQSGYSKPYDIKTLSYIPDNNIFIDADFSLEPLKDDNKDTFRKINNSAFFDCPNGGIIDEADTNNFIEKYNKNPDLIGVFKYKNESIGTFELSLENNIGFIESIGIDSNFQGKGFGKKLLIAVINHLKNKDAKQINLNVVSTNTKAVKLYENFGFKFEKILSLWFEKSLYKLDI